MVNKTKIAIIKSIMASEEISKYNKEDFIKLVVETEVEEKSKFWISTASEEKPL